MRIKLNKKFNSPKCDIRWTVKYNYYSCLLFSINSSLLFYFSIEEVMSIGFLGQLREFLGNDWATISITFGKCLFKQSWTCKHYRVQKKQIKIIDVPIFIDISYSNIYYKREVYRIIGPQHIEVFRWSYALTWILHVNEHLSNAIILNHNIQLGSKKTKLTWLIFLNCIKFSMINREVNETLNENYVTSLPYAI